MHQALHIPLGLITTLSLLHRRSWLALVRVNGVQHDLDGIVLCIVLVALGPVVTDGVGEYAAILVEGRRRDTTAHVRVPL